MIGLHFIVFGFLLCFLPIYFMQEKSLDTKITIWWYTFGIFIALIEFAMFKNQDYMSTNECPINDGNNWYFRKYNLSRMFDSKLWTDGWKEYCKQSGDFRYLETMKGDFAPWIEFINGIIAVVIGSYIIYGLYTKNISHINVAIAILMLSATQIFGTILYYSSYYTKCFHKLEKVGFSWFFHLVIMNILWIIFPTFVSYYAYKMIVNNSYIS